MAKNPFDQFSKQFFEAFLSPYGEVRINYEVPGESRYVDIFFTPSQDITTIPESLGILRRIASRPCLIEPFRNQPKLREVSSCVSKLLFVQLDFERQAQRNQKTLSEEELPLVWILTPTTSDNFLETYGATLRSDWLDGMYFSPKGYYTVFVAIHSLPSTPETLLFRLFGKGRVQQQAVREILNLPETDNRRSVILQLLSTWKISIEVTGESEEKDEDLAMIISEAYQQWEEATKRLGMEQGQRISVENLLKARFGEVDEQLSAIVPKVLATPIDEYTPLLLQLSREELIAHFRL